MAESEHRANALGPAGLPAKPVISSYERYEDTPFALFDEGQYTLGWQFWPDKKGGPGFATLRRSGWGSPKVVGRFPLTDEGWAAAWPALVRLDPANAEKV